jgi:aryl-alcohol dehydrogenase
MAARLCGCHPIIAVDIKASRLQLAENIGATHTIDPDGLEPVKGIRALSRSGAEFSVETTGLPGVTRQAAECLTQGGACALAGVAATDAEATLELNQLRRGRTVGAVFLGTASQPFSFPASSSSMAEASGSVMRLTRTRSIAYCATFLVDALRGVRRVAAIPFGR